MYYEEIESLNDLVGDRGLLRLPAYLSEVFIFDEDRARAVEMAVKLLIEGQNVLIEGRAGVGKTALVFMVIKRLLGIRPVGYIKDGVSSIGREHEKRGMILFYDDIPRMNPDALRSIVKNNVRGIIATARVEEVSLIRERLGINIYDYFESIRVTLMSREKLREMLLKYAEKEAVKIASMEAVNKIVEKAEGLPVYVWQVIRELKIRGEPLTLEHARMIPQGMLDYVDDILWRILGGRKWRREVLITLLCMTYFVKYAIHQDLYYYVYLAAKERAMKQRLNIEDIMMDAEIEDIARYLVRDEATYSFRLPHDSWADVLRGKSKGPMSPEIEKIVMIYARDERIKNIITYAAKRAWQEIIAKSDDLRRKAFERNITISFSREIFEKITGKPTEAILEPISAPPKIEPKKHAEQRFKTTSSKTFFVREKRRRIVQTIL